MFSSNQLYHQSEMIQMYIIHYLTKTV